MDSTRVGRIATGIPALEQIGARGQVKDGVWTTTGDRVHDIPLIAYVTSYPLLPLARISRGHEVEITHIRARCSEMAHCIGADESRPSGD